jgi:3-oxoacyl-[acyl-carrier-protein] synthase III
MTTDGFAERVGLQVLGTGSELPGAAVSTEALLDRMSRFINTRQISTARIIAERLGITARHLSRDLTQSIEAPRPQHTAPKLAASAVRKALHDADLDPTNISYLIGHTTTPHTQLPPNVSWVADELGYRGPSVELRQACTGFAAALSLCAGMIALQNRRLAIVGSELGSVYFDAGQVDSAPDQIVNLVQMGDGAGAILLGPIGNAAAPRIEFVFYGSLGIDTLPGISLQDGASGSAARRAGTAPQFLHDYAAVRRGGVALLRQGLHVATEAGYGIEQFDWIIPHQANGRMASICGAQLGLDPLRVVNEGGQLGNVGSAAIWIALDRLRSSGHLRPGHRVLALGAEASKFMYGGFVYVHGDA